MKILVTGAAGFIGSAVAAQLARSGHDVVGVDNLNTYYDPRLKLARLRRDGFHISPVWPLASATPSVGIPLSYNAVPVAGGEGIVTFRDIPYAIPLRSDTIPRLRFMRLDIADREQLARLQELSHFDIIVHLAAQAGVRYSLENPDTYVRSNIVGFVNLLEFARSRSCRHFIYASSSSVYGGNAKIPFSEDDTVDTPVSLYAATKRSDELIAGVYSRLYGMPLTGLRFFTVYGPWGRPDMAPFLFSQSILADKEISLFNDGDMSRDFTYIDDIVEGVVRVVEKPLPPGPRNEIYNIGRGEPTRLLDFITALENALGKKARCKNAPMQPGDVRRTWADTTKLRRDYGYSPATTVADGTRALARWLIPFLAHSRIYD